MNRCRKKEQALFPKTLENRAAPEIGQRARSRPDHVVNADHSGKSAPRPIIADLRFQCRPGEAHAHGPANHHADLSGDGLPTARKEQAENSDRQPRKQRGEIPVFLSKFSAVPRREDVDETVDRGESQVLRAAEPEMSLQIKEDVIIEVNGAERVESLEPEIPGIETVRRVRVQNRNIPGSEGGAFTHTLRPEFVDGFAAVPTHGIGKARLQQG